MAIVALSGCSADDLNPEEAEAEEIKRAFNFNPDFEVEQAGEEQLQALRDGEVTEDEYDAGFERYRSCMSAGGYEIHSTQRVGTVWRFSIPGEAVDVGLDEECYIREYKFVDTAWQIAHEDDMRRIETINVCLNDRGLPTATTLTEAEQRLPETGLDFEACQAELESTIDRMEP